MPFVINYATSTEQASSRHATASQTLNKALELEHRGIEIRINDTQGRQISIDELCAICEADEDLKL